MESGGGDDAVEYVVRDSHRTLLVALKDATEGLPIRPELPGTASSWCLSRAPLPY